MSQNRSEAFVSISLKMTEASARRGIYLLAKNNECKTLATLLDLVSDLDHTYAGNKTALHIAAESGSKEAVALLLQHRYKADINLEDSRGLTAVDIAREHKYTAIETMLLKSGAIEGEHISDEEKYPPGSVASFLGGRYAHASARDFLKGLQNSRYDEDSHSIASLLFLLAENDEDKTLSEMINKIDTLDTRFEHDKTILHAAVECGSSKALAVLLSPTNKEKMNLNSRDQDGLTPLHSAITFEQVDIARQLLEAGANPDFTKNDCSAPIHTAALSKNPDLMKVLVEFKAVLNRIHLDKQDCTAAHIAAACDNVKVIEVLLAAKADFRKTDTKGLTPLGVAAMFGADASTKVMLDNLKEEDCRNDLLLVRKKLQEAVEEQKGSVSTSSFKR